MRREKSFRIDVHHANAVVWEPVCRTRLISSNRASSYPHASILFTTTITLAIPAIAASARGSRVCPPPWNPLSNAPGDASTTSSATSARLTPAMAFGTKSLCPGASNSVTSVRPVVNAACATSTVTPRARSSGRSSSAHAHLNEPFPAAVASRSCPRRVFSSAGDGSIARRAGDLRAIGGRRGGRCFDWLLI